MEVPQKKQRLDHAVSSAGNDAATFDDLSDVLPNIFSFLPPNDIMRSRRVNKKTREAVNITIVPPAYFCVGSVETYNAMNVMTRAMPNLQQITICNNFGWGRHKWSDGEDPDEGLAAKTADWTTHGIEIISNFSKLRYLEIDNAGLNGRYPFLFNSFPLLQKLSIKHCYNLKWDLDMAGLPMLKELDCAHNYDMPGDINSLRVLKETLEKVHIHNCKNVEGNFMDLADFPHLKELDLRYTAVTGDIRDIGANDFSSLEKLSLPEGVYGCSGYKFQRISEANDLVRTLYLLKKQHPALSMLKHWQATLSKDSPEWYEAVGEHVYQPPLTIRFVQVGSRVGYRWGGKYGWDTPCEVNWLDPEPDTGSSDYEKYTEELQQIESEVNFYKGFHQPPTEEEYNRLCREYIFRR